MIQSSSRRKGRPPRKKRRRATASGETLSLLANIAWDSGDPEAEVRRLIDQEDGARALALARRVHEHRATAESETLLADAYLARLEGMGSRMAPEADALLGLAHTHCPAHRARFSALQPRLWARQGRFDELLAPLADDPALTDSRRQTIEQVVAQEAIDLEALAATHALPSEHPLRVAAGAIWRALRAVTQGAVDNDVIALSEISRRSPLAPWRLLVQAIAQFYRRDDAACASYLDRIQETSAAARLVPALRAMLGEPKRAEANDLSPPAQRLVRQVGAADLSFREALQAADNALSQQKRGPALAALRNVAKICRRSHPERVDELRRRVSIRCIRTDLPVQKLRRALGGPPPRDARFWRLFARACELHSDASVLEACASWEEFRRVAVAEGWFDATSPEAAAVHLHVAELLLTVPPQHLSTIQASFRSAFSGYHDWYADQPAALSHLAPPPGPIDFGFLDPEVQLQRACAGDPRPHGFERWLSWAVTHTDWKVGQRAAEAWHQAHPADSRPLLYLMEASERRGALTKAQRYLERAERADPLKPEIRRARLRLLVALAIRHLKQRHLHLVERDLAALAALPQIATDDGLAVLAALRCVFSALKGDKELAARHRDEAAAAIGSEAGAAVFGSGLQRACGLQKKGPFVVKRAKREAGASAGALASRVAHGLKLAQRFDISAPIPSSWTSAVTSDLVTKDGDPALQAAELQALAEGALRGNEPRLAYAASSAGLARGDAEPLASRFLLLRARSLPAWAERRVRCAAAAAALGRATEDLALVAEAVDLEREAASGYTSPSGSLGVAPPRMLIEEAQQVLAAEREARRYPKNPVPDGRLRNLNLCDCPACRAERGEGLEPDEFETVFDALNTFDEDDDDTDLPFDLPDMPPNFPPKLLPLMLEALAKYGPSALDPDVLRRLDANLFARLMSAAETLDDFEVGGPRRSARKRGRGRKQKQPKKRRR